MRFYFHSRCKMSSKSHVWDYFEKMGNTSKCLLCKRVISTKGNTSNLHAHLRYKHPIQFRTLQEASRRSRDDENDESNRETDDSEMEIIDNNR